MKLALVTGAARGQGRSHAVRLASDGYGIIAVDLCADLVTTDYPGATKEDLDQTLSMVRDDGGSAHGVIADVRDLEALNAAVTEGIDALGGELDVVVANAGIAGGCPIEAMEPAVWAEMIDVDLTGVWNSVKATVPHLLARGHGSIVLISSANGGLKAPPNLAHYAAAKHGVVGLMRSLANELGPRGIRVNSVHPTAVDTDMIHNDATYRLFRPDLTDPTRDDVVELFKTFHSLPIPWIEPRDVSAAVAFLASDRARYVTGVTLTVDGGLSAR